MVIRLVDRDNHTVVMTKEEIAESLRKMGNPAGEYVLPHVDEDGFCPRIAKRAITMGDVVYGEDVYDVEHTVLQFRASTMPHYRFYQLWHKKFRWWLKQRALRKQFDAVNTKGLIWKPTPFVLEMPWLRLKGKKAVTVEVRDKTEQCKYAGHRWMYGDINKTVEIAVCATCGEKLEGGDY